MGSGSAGREGGAFKTLLRQQTQTALEQRVSLIIYLYYTLEQIYRICVKLRLGCLYWKCTFYKCMCYYFHLVHSPATYRLFVPLYRRKSEKLKLAMYSRILFWNFFCLKNVHIFNSYWGSNRYSFLTTVTKNFKEEDVKHFSTEQFSKSKCGFLSGMSIYPKDEC